MTDRRAVMYGCLQVYIEMNQPVMAASLCLELGNALKVKAAAEESQRSGNAASVDFKALGDPLVLHRR